MIAGELPDFTAVAERLGAAKKVEDPERLIHQAVQALLTHQCLYSDTPRCGAVYDLINRERAFFAKLFGAMGYELRVDSLVRMVSLSADTPAYGVAASRRRKDETLVLLALRWMFEDATRNGQMDDLGRIDTDTDALLEVLERMAAGAVPSEARLDDILGWLRRKGLVRVAEKDQEERVTPLTILPGIRIVVTDRFVERLNGWAEEADTAGSDVFDALERGPPSAPAGAGDPAVDASGDDAEDDMGLDGAGDGADDGGGEAPFPNATEDDAAAGPGERTD